MSDTIKVSVDGKPAVVVTRSVYVKAKTKQLREFRYPSLTEDEVNAQIDLLLQPGVHHFGENGMTVIGMFIKDEVVQ